MIAEAYNSKTEHCPKPVTPSSGLQGQLITLEKKIAMLREVVCIFKEKIEDSGLFLGEGTSSCCATCEEKDSPMSPIEHRLTHYSNEIDDICVRVNDMIKRYRG